MSRTELLKGASFFNEGKYWEAHEAWEGIWRRLIGEARLHLQGLIQACGAFHLLGVGRVDPAARMAHAALEKLKANGALVEVAGLESVLSALAAGEADVLARASQLRAQLRES